MVPMFRLGYARPSALSRIAAALGVALILALTVFAASPELHGWLHSHDAGAQAAAHDGGRGQVPDDDDGCAVTLFAQGILLPLALLALAFTGQTLRLLDFAQGDRVIPDSPRYLRLPAQAPPLALI
ncbi:MAG TPA: hypothetical protein VII43_09920 [Opitutaceae bacterium]